MALINDDADLYRDFVRNEHIDTSTSFWKNPLLIGGVVAGALTGPFAIMGLVGMLGFGAGGIASSSLAASFMSLYGGAVSSGSVCAILLRNYILERLRGIYGNLRVNYAVSY